jgi:hypothetical protein
VDAVATDFNRSLKQLFIMGFLNRPEQKSTNPTSKFLEWKSNNKSFSFYDKVNKQNVEVKLPLTFLVLEEYHTIKGFSDSDQTGIYANEILQISAEEFEVKTFKGRVIAKGVYSDIKGAVNAAGGNYHKSIYAVTKEGDLINISFKGAAVSKYSQFTEKGAWKRLTNEWVTIEDAEDHKKGMVAYSTPNFKFNTSLSDYEFKIVEAKANELESYMDGYLAKDEPTKVEEPALVEDKIENVPF